MTTYYVAPAGEHPTIQSVFDNHDLEGGDIIEVASGTYTGDIVWGSNDGGSEGNPVILKAATGATVNLRSARAVTSGWTGPDENGVYTLVTIIGNIDFVTEDFVTLGDEASTSACSDGNWFYDAGEYLKLYYKPTSGLPTDHVVEYMSLTGELHGTINISNISDITIDGITFMGGNIGIHPHSTSANMNRITIQNCTFTRTNTGVFVYVDAGYDISYVSITNNTISHGRSGFKGYCANGTATTTHWTITGNTVTDCGLASDWSSYPEYATDREAFGLSDISDSIISDNVVTGGVQTGIYLYANSGSGNSGNFIIRNKWVDTVSVAINIGGDPDLNYANDGNTIAYNVLINAGTLSGDPIAIKLYNGTEATAQNYLYNNTVIGAGEAGLGYALYINDDATYYTVKNNIFSGIVYRAAYIPSHATVILDYNLYYKSGGLGNTDFVVALVGFKTWAEWQSAGYDTHGIHDSDPLLVSASDCRLLPASPAIDAGADVGLATDYLDNHAPRGAGFDIGAYEFYCIFSCGDYADLPETNDDLSHIYTQTQVDNVKVAGDSLYALQVSSATYTIHQFKYLVTEDQITFKWTGKSDIAPTSQIVKLQIWNAGTSLWDDMDADSSASAGASFDLEMDGMDVSTYKDASGYVTFRVYQHN